MYDLVSIGVMIIVTNVILIYKSMIYILPFSYKNIDQNSKIKYSVRKF